MMKHDARRILVVDDTPAIHADFQRILKHSSTDNAPLNATRDLLFGEVSEQTSVNWQVDSALQGDEGIERVRRSLAEGKPYSVAFVDMRMPPGKNGLETTREIWRLDPEVLVVLCTAYTDFTWNEIVAQLGTSDRLLILKKPFESIEVRQMALALSQRWNIARTDPLTGILNRRALLEHLQRWWLQSQTGEPLTCIMLDLDHFKRINDSCGHQAGDEVLLQTAQLLRQQVRPTDVVARYGGEEFCVLMPGVDEAGASDWAEKFRAELKHNRIKLGDRTLSVTASIGIAQRSESTATAPRLIEAADNALYVAKRSGRDCIIAQSTTNGLSLPQTAIRQSLYAQLAGLSAEAVMTRLEFTLSQSTSLEQAANLMLQARTGTMVVVDEDQRLAGALSDGDILQASVLANDTTMQVKDVMQAHVTHFDVGTSAEHIAPILMRDPHRKIVVTKERRPIGTLERIDLMRWLATAKRKLARYESSDCQVGQPSEEDDVVQVLQELRSECGQLLQAARRGQAITPAPVIRYACRVQEKLMKALADQRPVSLQHGAGI